MHGKTDQESLRYIISRLLKKYNEAIKECEKDRSDFAYGRRLAYYEILDIIQSELDIHGMDLKEFGIDKKI